MTDTTENTAFFIGGGFLDLPAWSTPNVYERGALEHINSGVSGAVIVDGIINLQNALFEAYQANAVFLMRRATWDRVGSMRDGNGNFLWPQKGTSMRMLGKPVVLSDDMQEVAVDSLSIAYGDFGVSFASVDGIHVRHNDPFAGKQFTEFYVKRGDVLNFESIKILKLAA